MSAQSVIQIIENTSVIEVVDEVITVDTEEETLVIETPAEQGPRGPAGETVIGGYAVTIESPKSGDVLVFAGSHWGNESMVRLTDGGNF